MIVIWTDKESYARGETVTVNYTISGVGMVIIKDPNGVSVLSKRVPFRGEGTGRLTWTILSSAKLGRYALKVTDDRGDASTVIDVINGTTPPVSGFTDTGEVTPKTKEVAPGTYDILFKLTGYEDKTVTGVVVSEGTTKTVSVTLISKVVVPVPQTKAFITFKSVPSGAGIWAKKI